MKAKRIVIVGADPDLSRIVHMCLSAYMVPVGIHYVPGDSLAPVDIAIDPKEIYGTARNDKAYLESLPKTIPPLDEETFRQMAGNQDIEILSGAYGLRERNHFLRVLMHGKNKLKIKQPVRHPAYLLDRLTMHCNGYVCAGYPGSGNMLVQNILSHILRHKNILAEHNMVTDTAAQYALSYWSTLSTYIESHFYDAGFWRSQTSPTHEKYGALYLDLDKSDRPSMVAGLPVNAHFWADPWTGSHEPPTQAALETFGKCGFKFIFIVRNPLDIIVSVAGKTTSLAKERSVAWLMDNRQWFEDMLSGVAYYYRQAKENQDRLIIAKYEDFLSSPGETITNFAKAMNIPLRRGFADELWSQLSGATLSADPGHYWQPGEGKWREYIPVEYRPVIEASGIVELAKEFGYAIDLNLLARKQGDHAPLKQLDNTILALEETRWFFHTGKPPSITASDIVVIEDKNLMAATYRQYEKQFRDLFASPILGWLMDAVGETFKNNFISAQQPEKIKSKVASA